MEKVIFELVNAANAVKAVASEDMVGEFALPVVIEDDAFDLEAVFRDALGYGVGGGLVA